MIKEGITMTDTEYHEFLEELVTILDVSSLTSDVVDWLENHWYTWYDDIVRSGKTQKPRNYANCDSIVKSSLLNYLIEQSETSDNVRIY